MDRLLVSETGNPGSYEPRNCYLFSNSLVLWQDQQPAQVFPFKPRQTAVDAPKPSVIKITSLETAEAIWLHSDTSSIIDKWGVAFSDFLFTFPAEILTSTVELSSIEEQGTLMISAPAPKLTPVTETAPVMFEESEYEDSDSDSDKETIDQVYNKALLDNSKIDHLFMSPNDNSDNEESENDPSDDSDDSDIDSDYETITKVKNGGPESWNSLFSELDRAIAHH